MGAATSDEPDLSTVDYGAQFSSLLDKSRALYSSLCDFQAYLASKGKENVLDLRSFRNAVHADVKSLERLAQAESNVPAARHALRSTNLPFLLAVWNTARSCRGVVALSRRFFHDASAATGKGLSSRKGVLVDVVALEGQEWVKVSTINERSLLYQLARVGWTHDSDSDDEDGIKVMAEGSDALAKRDRQGLEDGQDEDDDEDDKVELVKMAQDLSRVAKGSKVRYKYPRVRLILAKIIEGREPVIDKIIEDVRATGVTVECNAPGLCESIDFASSGDILFDRMAPSPLAHLTPTLNLDCTILLALISDLSHLNISADSTAAHAAISRQIAAEASDPLLPTELYPALGNRRLVCAAPAARRMREIVGTVGTEAEKRRAELVMGEGRAGEMSPAQLRDALRANSDHPVPENLLLPVGVESEAVDLAELPPLAAVLRPQLSEINRSVLFLGWARGWTTVTSNRAVIKQVEQAVEGEEGEPAGPPVWVCTTARSLIGKETRHKG